MLQLPHEFRLRFFLDPHDGDFQKILVVVLLTSESLLEPGDLCLVLLFLEIKDR